MLRQTLSGAHPERHVSQCMRIAALKFRVGTSHHRVIEHHAGSRGRHRPGDLDTLPFPFNIRAVVSAWNAPNFRPIEHQPTPRSQRSEAAASTSCREQDIATPATRRKKLYGADKTDSALQSTSLQGCFAPEITADERTGIGSRSIDDTVSFLKTGTNAQTVASGPMAEEIVNSSSRMTDANLRAIRLIDR